MSKETGTTVAASVAGLAARANAAALTATVLLGLSLRLTNRPDTSGYGYRPRSMALLLIATALAVVWPARRTARGCPA